MQKQKTKTEKRTVKSSSAGVERNTKTNAGAEQEQKLFKLKEKLFDIEGVFCRIETINNLLTCFANENCEEGAIIAELISEKLEEVKEIIYAE